MSISQLFPEEGPTLNLNFAGSRTLDPRITFTRTSSGTCMGPDGLIKVIPANSPRFDHRYANGEIESLGLLVEEQRTNLNQFSQPTPADISKASNQEGWLNPNVPQAVYTQTLSPDGTNNAINVNLTEGAASNFFIPFFYTQQSTLSNNTFYTLSFWADVSDLVPNIAESHLTIIIGTNQFSSLSGRYFRINLNRNTNTFSNLSYTTGSQVTATNAQTIFPQSQMTFRATNFPNNYKKIEITFKLENYTGFYDSGNTLPDIRFSHGVYMGNSGETNSNIGKNLKTWGWQLEQGAFPTSYIPTQGSTATRTPDNASITGSNFSDWYNQSEGTVFASFKCDNWNSSNAFGKVFTINQENFGVEDNGFWIGNDANTSNSVRYRVRSGGANQFGPANLTRNSNIVKSTIAVKSSNFAITIDGNVPTTSTSGTLPQVMNSLTIGRDIVGIDIALNGTISQLTYYPVRLSNEQLQFLTK